MDLAVFTKSSRQIAMRIASLQSTRMEYEIPTRYAITPAIVNLVAAISEIIVISWWPSYEQRFLCIIFPSITDPDHLEEQTP